VEEKEDVEVDKHENEKGKEEEANELVEEERIGGHFARNNIHHAGRDSSVRIPTRYGLGVPGIESR
jgi:hypothetical protein